MDITGKKRQELLNGLEERILKLEENIRNNNTLLEIRAEENAGLKKTVEALRAEIKDLREENGRLKAAAASTRASVNSLMKRPADTAADAEVKGASEAPAAGSAGDSTSGIVYDTLDYFDFENHFRGPEEVIRQRQLQYLPYFEGHENVLDIGCGRGEFLELLKERGISARGVDFFEPFVEYGRLNGLDITCGDGIMYLKNVPDASLGGIMCAQVVEHLDTEQIITLCNAAFNKLAEGAYFIIETPNPRCLSIYTNSFYVDPSHVKPVHPDSLMYYLEKAGFTKMKLVETKESTCGVDIPELKGEGIENLAAFNSLMKRLGQKVWGSQDYAVIAEK